MTLGQALKEGKTETYINVVLRLQQLYHRVDKVTPEDVERIRKKYYEGNGKNAIRPKN